MKVGDMVKLTSIATVIFKELRGIVLEIYPDPLGGLEDFKVSVLWTDGDHTEEFEADLEVTCK